MTEYGVFNLRALIRLVLLDGFRINRLTFSQAAPVQLQLKVLNINHANSASHGLIHVKHVPNRNSACAWHAIAWSRLGLAELREFVRLGRYSALRRLVTLFFPSRHVSFGAMPGGLAAGEPSAKTAGGGNVSVVIRPPALLRLRYEPDEAGLKEPYVAVGPHGTRMHAGCRLDDFARPALLESTLPRQTSSEG
ncbi:hypothetical protein BDV10DRAFT_149777 [Aspergillus recurvatus]